MATSEGQDIVRCQLCPNPVEHHCNLCHVDLCPDCISTHMADKSKRHEVVDFINRKEGPFLPECIPHGKTPCEVYCNDCQEPTCVLCVTTTHKKHDNTDIKSIIEKLKRRIADDVEDLENIIRPKYKQNFGIGYSIEEFDKVLNAIQDQEDNICKVVREIGSQLKDEVAKQKREFEQNSKEFQSSVAKEEKELNAVIKSNKGILKSDDAKCILTYQSKNEQFRGGPKQMQISCPMFLSGKVSKNQLQEMFGSLQSSTILAIERKLGMHKLLANPVVLSSIQTPYGNDPYLWRVLCENTGKVWISGDDSKIYQIDRNRSILKTISISSNAFALSLSVEKELIFSLYWPDTKLYGYEGDIMWAVFDLGQWCPRGLCHSANGNFLVSMRSVDETQSRVVRYSGTTETMVIQNDSKGKPLFSARVTKALFLTENGNGDICVADYAGEAVIVVSESGKVRFRYKGNLGNKSKYTTFKPLHITNNVNSQILINDHSNDTMHLIDSDGNFLRYMEYQCIGGLSIDSDHNLMVGEYTDGKIRIIKYLT